MQLLSTKKPCIPEVWTETVTAKLMQTIFKGILPGDFKAENWQRSGWGQLYGWPSSSSQRLVFHLFWSLSAICFALYTFVTFVNWNTSFTGEWIRSYLVPEGHIAKINIKASKDPDFFSVKLKQSTKIVVYKSATEFLEDLPKSQQPTTETPSAPAPPRGYKRTREQPLDLTTKKTKTVSM